MQSASKHENSSEIGYSNIDHLRMKMQKNSSDEEETKDSLVNYVKSSRFKQHE